MWWANVLSSAVGAVVLFVLTRVPVWVRSAVRKEMGNFCEKACPVRQRFEARITALERFEARITALAHR